MATTKPAIVVVPGAWHVPEHYEPAAKRLRTAGYETVVVRHPSVSVSRDSGNMLRKDATVTSDIVRKLANDETKNVVLIMHSYGGISGSEAAAMATEWLQQNGQPDHGKIVRLVFLAAHALEKGESFLTGRTLPLEISDRGMMAPLDPYNRYYSDISPSAAQPAIDLCQPMAHSAFTSSTTYCGWKDYGIPCTFVSCAKDQAVGKAMCEKYVARMRDAGVDLRVEEVQTGHSPFWVDPEALVEVLGRVVG